MLLSSVILFSLSFMYSLFKPCTIALIAHEKWDTCALGTGTIAWFPQKLLIPVTRSLILASYLAASPAVIPSSPLNATHVSFPHFRPTNRLKEKKKKKKGPTHTPNRHASWLIARSYSLKRPWERSATFMLGRRAQNWIPRRQIIQLTFIKNFLSGLTKICHFVFASQTWKDAKTSTLTSSLCTVCWFTAGIEAFDGMNKDGNKALVCDAYSVV